MSEVYLNCVMVKIKNAKKIIKKWSVNSVMTDIKKTDETDQTARAIGYR